MSSTFKLILDLVARKDIMVSDHGYAELSSDNIFLKEILASVDEAVVVEDYADYMKGPCVLVLQKDSHGAPIHVVWGIPKGASSPAVLVTGYRPDRNK